MNTGVWIGRWTKDVELKSMPNSDKFILHGTLAVDKDYKVKEGEPTADFLNVVIFGKTAENTANFAGSKGCSIGIKGHLQSRSYKVKHKAPKSGEEIEITHYATEIVADQVQFLEKKGTHQQAPQSGNPAGFGAYDMDADTMTPVDDGDIPF